MDGEPVRFRLRVRYRKTGRLAYLGHLEVMQTIERAIRRAGLPYAVTQGFSPRMKAGYSSALPVGTSSTCEWYDVFLTELVPADEALARLQSASPSDLLPDRVGYIDVHAPALTAQITRVAYRILLFPAGAPLARGRVEEELAAVRDLGQIPYLRGRKRKVLEVGRLLVGCAVEEAPEGAGVLALALDTRTTNDGALRPEILLTALDRRLSGAGADEGPIESTGQPVYRSFARVQIERTGQFAEDGEGGLLPPLPEPAPVPAPPVSAALGMV